jgi:hypothetical protein
LDRRLDGPQNQSRRCGEEINLFPLPEIEPDSIIIPPLEAQNIGKFDQEILNQKFTNCEYVNWERLQQAM